MKRYVRNIAVDQIDIIGQEKLNEQTALVVGAGGLGCHLLFHLSSLGFKNIIIMDYDTVSISNLQRQILFNEKSIGKNKALEANNTLSKYNSDVSYFPLQKKFNSIDYLIKKYEFNIDIIFDCSDNFETKILLSKEALKHKIPAVFASVGEFNGWVFPQFYKNTTPKTVADVILPNQNDITCDNLGVISPSVAFVASIQAMEGLKYFIGLESEYDKLIDINCLSFRVTELEF